ncbi:chemotaxis protein CheX [Mobiluncus sp.]|uniref:chemotaxis protein CheX n=1 Tax=Mobiluncus sp. TaxID=47293 RepID=UPI002A90F0E5|nr:chemotaxis protein CheX [Mobiluncus sp.]MDY6077251.1 chemotaxis protein CheX [Mobiluncus sp.]
MDQEVREAVLNIANDVFYALIDKHEGTVTEWLDEIEPFQNPVYAWVDSQGDKQLRVMLEMEDSTAKDLTRAMYRLGETDEVTEEDQQDAFGEIVNVIGGNMKSIVEDSGNLILPQVRKEKPGEPESPLISVNLYWKGKFLVVSISDLNATRDAA